MLRSLSSAVLGMRNHQTKLDVVGNNIANVNTVAYKSDAARFQDMFNQTLRGATTPMEGRGGVNPVQIGMGMELSSIDTNQAQGAITDTGRETDLAIEGNGFFVVNDGERDYYTRDGTFNRDSTGVLVNSNGLRLMGWLKEEGEELDVSETPGEISIPLGEQMVARATSNLGFSGNLGAGEEDEIVYDTHVYDSLGTRHGLVFTFTKDSENQWSYEVELDDEDGTEIGSGTIGFTEAGNYDDDEDGATDIEAFTFDPGNGAAELNVMPDFSDLTQLDFSSNITAKSQDGFAPGELATFNIESTGVITGTYTNGIVREIGQVAMASFANPEGLSKMGSNLYDISGNSGGPRIGLPDTEGRGLIQSGALEMSNVDLANEFTEMITTNRAFQANTRVISTSDEVLLELINISR